MGLSRIAVALVAIVACAASAPAQDFRIEDVPSVTARPVAQIKPLTILFSDRTQGDKADPGSGLIRFDDWAKRYPDRKQLLSLYPGYTEPELIRRGSGRGTRTAKVKLTMYLAEARFVLHRVPTLDTLNRFTTLAVVEALDPAIKHRLIAPADIVPRTDAKYAHNRNPARPWCTGAHVACLRSHYQLEGKLPIGIRLANKLRDASKKVAEYLEFESEIAILAPEQIARPDVMLLTGIDTPVVGALEQSTFYVNQVLQFAKFLAIVQVHPADANKAVVTAFTSLAIESKVLNTKKEYARVPVLRNLVPLQVLMGKSSFNTGNSISAGLPKYARSRIQAIARVLDGD